MSTSNDLKQAAFAALDDVYDPELKKSLIELGMIHAVDIIGFPDDTTARVDVIPTKPTCPLKEIIRRDIIAALLKIPEICHVEVVFANSNHASSQMNSTLASGRPCGIRSIIAVASGKGGVGKSTVSLNLAIALSQTGAQVGLLDGDLYGPNLPTMMGVHDARPVVEQGMLKPIESMGIRMMSIGFLIPENQPVIWRGPMLGRAIQQFLGEVDWGMLDYLIVDLPPGTGDVQISLTQTASPDGCIIVVTPQQVAFEDAIKAVSMFQKMEVPILGVVENMAWLVCECGKRHEIFGSGGGARLARQIQVPFFGSIPIDEQIRSCGDEGHPMTSVNPQSESAQTFKKIAEQLCQRTHAMSS